jgi:hypothetical protein
MVYEYHHEQVAESELAVRAADLGSQGWRLVCVVINPLATAEAAPLYITFWERVTS